MVAMVYLKLLRKCTQHFYCQDLCLVENLIYRHSLLYSFHFLLSLKTGISSGSEKNVGTSLTHPLFSFQRIIIYCVLIIYVDCFAPFHIIFLEGEILQQFLKHEAIVKSDCNTALFSSHKVFSQL